MSKLVKTARKFIKVGVGGGGGGGKELNRTFPPFPHFISDISSRTCSSFGPQWQIIAYRTSLNKVIHEAIIGTI